MPGQTAVRIGDRKIGAGEPCYVIAEIGINHNGDLELAKRLISVAVAAGCDAVKFQKRTVDVVYTPKNWLAPREPVRDDERRAQRALEFALRSISRSTATAAPWASPGSRRAGTRRRSISSTSSRCRVTKSHRPRSRTTTCCATRAPKGKPIILSTGMSTIEEVDHAVEVLGSEDLIIMHACSTYPASYEELNLRAIPTMHDALRRSHRILRPRDGHPLERRCGRARRDLRGAARVAGPRDVGHRSSRVARTQRHLAARARHSLGGTFDGRRPQTRVRAKYRS
jgi:N-acetylneuraminate synthase